MERPKRKVSPLLRQCFVAAAVCGNVIGHGCSIGFSAVLFPQLHQPDSPIPLTKEQDSWIASSPGISLLIGNFFTPLIMSRYGRRPAHLAVSVPSLLGWLLMITAPGVEVLILARMLLGLSFGMLMPLRSALLGEYTSPKYRGAFLTTISLAQTFGIFFVHLIGSLFHWQITGLICLCFTFIAFSMILYSPESPSWLASKGRYNECRAAFHWLRGEDEEAELEELILARRAINKEAAKKKELNSGFFNITETLTKKEFYKPVTVMLHFYFMTQFAGGTTMANYSTVVIKTLMGPEINAHAWMIALDIQRVLSNVLAVFIINKFRRRMMLFSTGALCVFSHFAIAIYVFLRSNSILNYNALWLPGLLLNLQMFSISVGVIPLSGVVAGEIFPLEYRSICGSISLTTIAILFFVNLKTFIAMLDSIGLDGTYGLFAGLIMYSLIVIWFWLPETKGKTLQQIENEFKDRSFSPEEITLREPLRKNDNTENKNDLEFRRSSSPQLA